MIFPHGDPNIPRNILTTSPAIPDLTTTVCPHQLSLLIVASVVLVCQCQLHHDPLRSVERSPLFPEHSRIRVLRGKGLDATQFPKQRIKVCTTMISGRAVPRKPLSLSCHANHASCNMTTPIVSPNMASPILNECCREGTKHVQNSRLQSR